jgi:hypothetical protein
LVAKWISLNGQDYAVKGDIDRFLLPPLAPAFRTIGLQRRDSLVEGSSFVFPPPIYGFGRKRMTDINDVRQAASMWRSQVETRFASQVTLALLSTVPTHNAFHVLRVSLEFEGVIRGFWESSSVDIIRTIEFDGTNWAGQVTVFNPVDDAVTLDAINFKDRMICLIGNSNDHITRNSSDASTWDTPTTEITANKFSNAITANEDIDGGLLASIGGEVVAVIWDEVAGEIIFFSDTAGTTWAVETNISIPSGNGPQGVVVYPGIDGADKLYVATREGIWEVDTAPATWTAQLIFPMTANNNNGRRMTIHNGALWIPVGVDDDTPAPMWRITVSGDTRVIEQDMGLDYGDGVESEMLGPWRWLFSAGGFLFASVGGGAASRNARVLCHNGLGWHHMFRNSTANEVIDFITVSAEPDGTPRLHYSQRSATNDSSPEYVAQPLVNPGSGISLTHAVNGILERPEFNGGMPRYNAAFLHLFYDAVDLGGDAQEEIDLKYGLDGDDGSTNDDLGDIQSGATELTWASGAGVSGRSIRIEETYNRRSSDTSKTPTGRELELIYDKHVNTQEGWRFEIDQEATADAWRTALEDVITRLQTARDLDTLAAFSYPQLGTVYVRFHDLRFLEAPEDADNKLDLTPREARIIVELHQKG